MKFSLITVTRATIWHTAVSCSFFVKRKALDDARPEERRPGFDYGIIHL